MNLRLIIALKVHFLPPMPSLQTLMEGMIVEFHNRVLFIKRLDNKNFWKGIPWSRDFIDIEGKLHPTQRTRIKMSWDSEYVYIGAEIAEKFIWGTITDTNSTMYHENDFEVFLDPDGSSHNY